MSDGTRVILDFSKTCRTCLEQKSTEELRSLLENNLEKVLCEIASIQLNLHSTSLPTSICTACLKILNLAIDFRNNVHKSEEQLKHLICSIDDTDPLAPITVIYKSFAVLECSGFTKESKSAEKCKEKYGDCEEVFVIEDGDNGQSLFESTASTTNTRKVFENVFGDNAKMYTVSGEIENTGDSIAYLISDEEDNSINTAKTHESEVMTNKSTIFINGNISNVIKWANSESNSISPSNNFIEINQKETANQKEVLATVQTTKTIPENIEPTQNNQKAKSKNEDDVEKMLSVKEVTETFKFSCKMCAKKFRYEYGYKAHLLKHDIPMVCELCNSTFNDTGTYLAHVTLNHPDFKPFACPSCDKSFAVMSTLKKHFMYHTAAVKPRKFACDICKKKFSQQNFLITHKRCHSGTNPYQCDVCTKKFSGAHSLRNHLKIHRGEKKHKCDICDARFIHRFSLRAHLRTHSGEKPFGCSLCNNKFSTSSYLKIHMRTHTSEKPYRCLWCEKNFVSRCALAAHEKSHTGEKKYQCDVCGWRSARLADLQTHLRTHTGDKPYFCDQCDKSYKTSSNLATHKKTHLGLREFICHICSKAFGDSRTLKGHIRIHTGETPYQCHICGNRFKQSGQLSAHRKTHRNNN